MSDEQLPNFRLPMTVALARIWDSWSDIRPLIATVKEIGVTYTPDDWVPWFIWDLGLEDIVPYVRDMRQALAEGPAWQRARGTSRGIEIGIGWVESAGVVAEPDQRHDWWQFQVAFSRPASDIEQLQQLVGIIDLSKAAEGELFRLFSPGADLRPIRMDWHQMDEGQADGYSGVRVWEGGPLVSMGWVGASTVETEAVASAAIILREARASEWFEGYRFDIDHMDERPLPTLQSAGGIAVGAEDYAFAHDAWPPVWPESWAAASQPSVTSTSWGEL